MDRLRAADVATISGVAGVGEVIADAVVSFFHNPDNRALVADLAALGLTMMEPNAAGSEGPLAGKTYVITGTLPTLSRGEATRLIEQAGGRVAGSVSKKTDALLAGEAAGSKLEKAKELGVPVIDEAHLLRLVQRTL
jgi:DNA ligase (NAD+)